MQISLVLRAIKNGVLSRMYWEPELDVCRSFQAFRFGAKCKLLELKIGIVSKKYLGPKQSPPNSHNDLKNRWFAVIIV